MGSNLHKKSSSQEFGNLGFTTVKCGYKRLQIITISSKLHPLLKILSTIRVFIEIEYKARNVYNFCASTRMRAQRKAYDKTKLTRARFI